MNQIKCYKQILRILVTKVAAVLQSLTITIHYLGKRRSYLFFNQKLDRHIQYNSRNLLKNENILPP